MMNLAAFKSRADESILIQVTDTNATAVDDVKVQRALDDAWSELWGYVFRLPVDDTPPVYVLDSHQFHIAMYRLVGSRAGTEFESIAARYKASIDFLKSLRSTPGASVIADAAAGEAIFDEGSLTEFGKIVVPE